MNDLLSERRVNNLFLNFVFHSFSDNGTNMVKAIRLLQQSTFVHVSSALLEYDKEEQDDEDSDTESESDKSADTDLEDHAMDECEGESCHVYALYQPTSR